METKHTPGPWTAEQVDPQTWEINAEAGDPTIGHRSWSGLAEVYGNEDEPEAGREVARANARLIANAPTLLQAAQHAIEIITESWGEEQMERGDCQAVNLLKAAVAKAVDHDG